MRIVDDKPTYRAESCREGHKQRASTDLQCIEAGCEVPSPSRLRHLGWSGTRRTGTCNKASAGLLREEADYADKEFLPSIVSHASKMNSGMVKDKGLDESSAPSGGVLNSLI